MPALVTGVLALAVAYRQGQVIFDIPPVRGELLALIAIMLWALCGMLRQWRSGDETSLLEWAVGGALVGVLMSPHVPQLAWAVWAGCFTFGIARLAMNWHHGVGLFSTFIARRPVLVLAALAMIGFDLGGAWDWIGFAFLVVSAVLMAWQFGRHLWSWSEGRTPIR